MPSYFLPPPDDGGQAPSGVRTASSFVPFTGAEIVTLQAGAVPTKAARKFAPDKDAALVANLWITPADELLRLDPTINVLGLCHSSYRPQDNALPGYASATAIAYSAGFPWPDADLEAWARGQAKIAADHMHYCGRVLGYGAKGNGTYGGPFLDLGFGYYQGEPAFDATAIIAHPGDTLDLAGCPPMEVTKRIGQYPHLVRTGDGQFEKNPIPWAQATLANGAAIAHGLKVCRWFWDELVAQCANYTRHGGAAVQLYLPESIHVDHESPVSMSTLHSIQFVNNAQGTYDPDGSGSLNSRVIEGFSSTPSPTVRGQPIPGYVRIQDVSMYLQSRKTAQNGSGPLWCNAEPIQEVYNSQGVLETQTFSQWWTWLQQTGKYDGTVPLPVNYNIGTPGTSVEKLLGEMFDLVEQNLLYRIKNTMIKAAEEKIGRAVEWTNYGRFKYNPAVSTDFLFGFPRLNNYYLARSAPTLYFAQYRGQPCDSVNESNRNAGLQQTRERLQLCDPRKPIIPWIAAPQANHGSDFLYGDEDFVAAQILLAWYEFDVCEFNVWVVDGTYDGGWEAAFKRCWSAVYAQFRQGHQDRTHAGPKPRIRFKGDKIVLVLEQPDVTDDEFDAALT